MAEVSSRELLVLGAILVVLVLGGVLSLLFHRRRPNLDEIGRRFGLSASETTGGEGFFLTGRCEGFLAGIRCYPEQEGEERRWKTSWELELGLDPELLLVLKRRGLAASTDERPLETGDALFDEAFRVVCEPPERLAEVLGADERALALSLRALEEVHVSAGTISASTTAEPSLRELTGMRSLVLALALRLSAGTATG